MVSTTASSILALAAFIIFSDGSYSGDGSAPNTDKVASGCGTLVDHRPETRAQALRSINYAIDEAVTATAAAAGGKARRNTSWATGPSCKVVAFANCSASLATAGCKRCLDNAQFRVINVECPYVFGGWIELVDCYVRYDIVIITSFYTQAQRWSYLL